MNPDPKPALRTTSPQKAKARTQGRPIEAEGAGRDVIIANTCKLLRTLMPAKVTRVMVAEASGVHPSLIQYYFRTRSSLMVAAAERMSHEYRRAIERRMRAERGSPRDQLRARVEAFIDLELSHPFFHRLLVEEVLSSEEPEARALSASLASRGIASYQAIVDAGVATGELRPVDGGWLFTSVISLCQFLDKAKILYRALAHPGMSEPELERSYRSFVCDLIMNAVATGAPSVPNGTPAQP